MQKTGIFWLLLLVPAVISQQCTKKVDYEKMEEENIARFLEANHITVEPTASGLYYVEKEEGKGLRPVENDTVSINYIAYHLNGVIFDTNIEKVAEQNYIWRDDVTYQPFRFVLGSQEVIDGVNEGISYMKEGGKATLTIPSYLAYHDHQTIVFYVELLEVVHDTSAVP